MNQYIDQEFSDETQPVFLEGMKVLFDEKVGLYPVTLVEETEQSEQPNG